MPKPHRPIPVLPSQPHASTISLHDFGKAMSSLDLSSVPPNKRMAATLDHMALIMGSTLTNQDVASEVRASRILRANKKLL